MTIEALVQRVERIGALMSVPQLGIYSYDELVRESAGTYTLRSIFFSRFQTHSVFGMGKQEQCSISWVDDLGKFEREVEEVASGEFPESMERVIQMVTRYGLQYDEHTKRYFQVKSCAGYESDFTMANTATGRNVDYTYYKTLWERGETYGFGVNLFPFSHQKTVCSGRETTDGAVEDADVQFMKAELTEFDQWITNNKIYSKTIRKRNL